MGPVVISAMAFGLAARPLYNLQNRRALVHAERRYRVGFSTPFSRPADRNRLQSEI